MVAGLADRGGRIAVGARQRMDVGDDFGRRALDALPALEDVLQEFQIFRRVDGGDRAKAVVARALDRAAGGLRAGKQALDALRLFRIGLRRAAGEERLGIVASLFVGKEGFHLSSACRPGRRRRRAPRSLRHRRHGSVRCRNGRGRAAVEGLRLDILAYRRKAGYSSRRARASLPASRCSSLAPTPRPRNRSSTKRSCT